MEGKMYTVFRLAKLITNKVIFPISASRYGSPSAFIEEHYPLAKLWYRTDKIVAFCFGFLNLESPSNFGNGWFK